MVHVSYSVKFLNIRRNAFETKGWFLVLIRNQPWRVYFVIVFISNQNIGYLGFAGFLLYLRSSMFFYQDCLCV